MKTKTTRGIRGWLRDMALGAIIFLVMPVATLITAGPQQRWTISEALAGDVMPLATPEFAKPNGPLIDYGFNLPAPTQIMPDSSFTREMSDWVVLGLTFSLLVAFNLAFLRHLRRVSASPRRN